MPIFKKKILVNISWRKFQILYCSNVRFFFLIISIFSAKVYKSPQHESMWLHPCPPRTLSNKEVCSNLIIAENVCYWFGDLWRGPKLCRTRFLSLLYMNNTSIRQLGIIKINQLSHCYDNKRFRTEMNLYAWLNALQF